MSNTLVTRSHKICAKCGQEKSRNSFGKGPNKTWCNRCNKEITKLRRSDAKKKLSTKYRDSAPDIEDLDDNEIEEELSKLMLARLVGEPELLTQLVDASGLRVVDTESPTKEFSEIVDGNSQ